MAPIPPIARSAPAKPWRSSISRQAPGLSAAARSALGDDRQPDLREQGRPLSPESRVVGRALDQLRHRRQGVVPEAGLGVDGGQLLPAGLAEPRDHLARWVDPLDRAARKDVAWAPAR